MGAVAGNTATVGQWGSARAVAGGGLPTVLAWLTALAKRWWAAWLAAPRKLGGGADPSLFVNQR